MARRRRPIVGDRVNHSGVSSHWWKDSEGEHETHTHFSEDGVLLAIERSGDRCTVRFDDGVTVDNIYIGYLRRL